MPLDLDTFNQARRPLDDQIEEALSKARVALNAEEVIAAVIGKPLNDVTLLILLERFDGAESKTWAAYAAALDRLVKAQRAVTAEVAGVRYYAAASLVDR